jgi:hypothetical protein
MSSFAPLARALAEHEVRYVLIGVSGANFHAHSAGIVFTTLDRDLFLPLDPDNLLAAWRACEDSGLVLSTPNGPLDEPRDRLLALRVVDQRALTRARDGDDLLVDLTFVMAGHAFEEVWEQRVGFVLSGVDVPVARLSHIVASKAAAGRPKDHLFIATHLDALQQLLPPEDGLR